jgi:GDPmannose 4,6-dehydratase
MKRALIIGITGQDGAYLAQLLHGKGYKVFGTMRRTSTPNLWRLRRLNIDDAVTLIYADLADAQSLERAIAISEPHEVYNLGAMSHVKVSFENPVYSADVTGTGVVRLLEMLRHLPMVKFYQASSSEMFGSSPPPQSEATPFHPCSPYGCAKVFAYNSVVNYREAYDMHASNGILFNHESPLRGDNFVTRKITKAIGAIRRGEQDLLELGNLEAKRDWGFAGDYVKAMWKMLQRDVPGDFVVATGENHSVREFAERAFKHAGLNWELHVRINSSLFRPTEVDDLLGDATKAALLLDWRPQVTFDELVKGMVDADL